MRATSFIRCFVLFICLLASCTYQSQSENMRLSATDATFTASESTPTSVQYTPTHPLPSLFPSSATLISTTVPSFPTFTPVPRDKQASIENIGTLLYVAPDSTALYRIRPNGNDKELLAVVPQLAHSTPYIQISPTGDSVLFTQYSNTGAFTAHRITKTEVTPLPIPRLSDINWSPDGKYLLGTFYQEGSDGISTSSLYIYSFVDEKETVLPGISLGTWGEDSTIIVYAKPTDAVARGNNPPVITQDIFQYNLITDQETQLTYTYTAPIDFLTERGGTDAWYIRQISIPGNSPYIFFSGYPHFLQTGAGANTTWWYRIPRNGLPRGEAPVLALLTNRDILINPLDTTIVAGVGRSHNNHCSNPDRIIARDMNDSIYKEEVVPVPVHDNTIVYVSGGNWSPTGRQLVFGSAQYHCENFEPTFVDQWRLYIWDSTINRMGEQDVSPRFIVEGRLPLWISGGAFSYSD